MPFNAILLGAGGLPIYEVNISSNRQSWKKSTDSTIPSNRPVIVRFTIEAGIVIQPTTAINAVTFDALADDSIVEFVNLGFALGRGGNGSAAGTHAIRANFNGRLRLTNASGEIKGGGGGGGLGGGCLIWVPGDTAYESHAGGGGGGGGAGGGTKGSGGAGFGVGPDGDDGTDGTAGAAGTAGAGGQGGDSSAGDGGSGGAYGVAGSAGTNGVRHGGGPTDGNAAEAGGAGGVAGFAIKHDAGTEITWLSGEANKAGSVGT